jgi:hypothetical protein
VFSRSPKKTFVLVIQTEADRTITYTAWIKHTYASCCVSSARIFDSFQHPSHRSSVFHFTSDPCSGSSYSLGSRLLAFAASTPRQQVTDTTSYRTITLGLQFNVSCQEELTPQWPPCIGSRCIAGCKLFPAPSCYIHLVSIPFLSSALTECSPGYNG